MINPEMVFQSLQHLPTFSSNSNGLLVMVYMKLLCFGGWEFRTGLTCHQVQKLRLNNSIAPRIDMMITWPPGGPAGSLVVKSRLKFTFFFGGGGMTVVQVQSLYIHPSVPEV